MNLRTALGSALCLVLLSPMGGAQQNAQAPKTLSCWNENGRRVCGDALPVNNSGARQTYNAAGVPTAAATPAAPVDAAKSREAREQNALAESYSSEQELQRAYQLRDDVSAGSIKAARASLNSQRKALIAVLEQAAKQELEGKRVAKPQADAVVNQRNAMLSTQQSVAQMQLDHASIAQDYLEAVRRYRTAKRMPLDAPVVPLTRN